MNRVFLKPYIRAISTVVPKNKKIFSDLYDTNDKYIKKIIKSTGIKSIRVADQEKTTVDYCLEASKNLLIKENINKDEIDGVVLVTQTSDYIMPISSAIIQSELNLKNNIITFDIKQACSGYIYGLLQSFLLVESGLCENVLLCVGDTITKYVNPKDKALALLLGDGFSATLISKNEKEICSAFSFFVDGNKVKDLIIPAGGHRIPCKKGITDIEEKDEYNNVRTQENMYMNGLEIMNFALSVIPDLIKNTLFKIGWNKDEINFYGMHQANAFMIKYLSQRLKVDLIKMPIYVDGIGNTGSATIPLLLTGIPKAEYNLKKSILCGFGAGLSAGIIATDLSMTNFIDNIIV